VREERRRSAYTATLDDQGRLTHLELDVPKAGETPPASGRST
jgi:hypothetical protein